MGVYGYVGCPGSGKTTLALSHATARGLFIILDLAAVSTFTAVKPRVTSPEHAALQCGFGTSPVWTPDDPAEVGTLCKILRRQNRGVSLLLDEAWYVWSPHHTVPDVSAWLRTTRHHGGNAYYTSQRYGDLSGDAHATTDILYVFRCTAPRDLDRLERERGLPRESVSGMKRFHSIALKQGFA